MSAPIRVLETRAPEGRRNAGQRCTGFPARRDLTVIIPDGNNYYVTIPANDSRHQEHHLREARDIDAAREDFERLCRERGIRVTPQRLAVYRLLAQDATHPTAEYVYGRLRRRMASLSFTTVYRVLECLEREGFVRRVGALDGAARYEANLTRHHHCVCRLCGRIIDCEDRPLQQSRLPWRAPAGFVADELEIRILGTCSMCRRARKPGRPVDVKRQPVERRV